MIRCPGGYLYPPSKNADLHELHERIITAPIADHYKQTLLFYLLKDCSGDGDTLAEDFAKAVCLPRKYWVVIEGLWHLDRLQFTVRLPRSTFPQESEIDTL